MNDRAQAVAKVCWKVQQMAIVIGFAIFDCAATQVLSSYFDYWKYALCALHET